MQSPSSERNARALIFLSAALMFFYGFLLGGMQLVIAEISELFGRGQTGVGMLVSVQHVTSATMPVLFGMAADRLGKGRLLPAASAIFGLGCLLAGAARSLWVYVPGALLIGLGYSVCESMSSAVLTDLDPVRGISYINLSQGMLSVGAILSPVLLRLCMDLGGFSWRLVFYICAGAFLVLSVPLAAVSYPKAGSPAAAAEKGTGRAWMTSWLFLAPFLSMILYVGLENGFGYFVESLFTSRLGRKELGAFAISAYWAGMAVSRFVFSVRTVRPAAVLRGSFAGSALLLALLAVSGSGWLSVCASALVGFAFGPVFSTLMGTAAARFPGKSATAAGLISTGCGASGILFPLLMGAISGHFSLPCAFLLLAATALGGLLLSCRQS